MQINKILSHLTISASPTARIHTKDFEDLSSYAGNRLENPTWQPPLNSKAQPTVLCRQVRAGPRANGAGLIERRSISMPRRATNAIETQLPETVSVGPQEGPPRSLGG